MSSNDSPAPPTSSPSPLATPLPWDSVAADYAAEVRPVFESYARQALRLAEVEAGMSIADVAAGPGTLSLLAAREGARVSALDFSQEMIAELRRRAGADGLSLESIVGDGMALPYEDGRFDAAFSLFGLMFFPDRARGFRELCRVLRPGGRAVISSWVPMERSPLMTATFAILRERRPDLFPERPVPPALTDSASCVAEMEAGGFVDVRVVEHIASAEFRTTAELVASFGRTNAVIVMMRRRLGERWAETEAALVAGLQERFGQGRVRFDMPANLTVGRRP